MLHNQQALAKPTATAQKPPLLTSQNAAARFVSSRLLANRPAATRKSALPAAGAVIILIALERRALHEQLDQLLAVPVDAATLHVPAESDFKLKAYSKTANKLSQYGGARLSSNKVVQSLH